MPLRDHFSPPLSERVPWDGLHGAWPTLIALDLNTRLPPEFIASPRIHLGTSFEIHVATSALDENQPYALEEDNSGGGVATAVWAPPAPTFAVATELPDQDEYEVRIEDNMRHLVAAVEIVSPGNKDRPESRRAFAAKCATLLRSGVSLSIIDLVTNRRSNLYAEVLDLLGQHDSALAAARASLYAIACRWIQRGRGGRLESWTQDLAVGRPLPTLPLWITRSLAMPLNLESTYEQTCLGLRIK